MIYNRLVPVLLFDDGAVFRTQRFKHYFSLGNPFLQLERYKAWDIDEIVYLDIGRTPGGKRLIDILPELSRTCFAPFAAGGGIRTLEDIHAHLHAGADRVVINSAAFARPEFITEAAMRYGNQAIVVSIDAKEDGAGTHEVFVQGGKVATGVSACDWAREAAERGAGEILINSIDRDGMGTGYDIRLIQSVAQSVRIPVIACGGVGAYDDFAQGIVEGGVGSVAAANIFAFRELGYLRAKEAMQAAGLRVRANATGEGQPI